MKIFVIKKDQFIGLENASSVVTIEGCYSTLEGARKALKEILSSAKAEFRFYSDWGTRLNDGKRIYEETRVDEGNLDTSYTIEEFELQP
jgi:hypothetical protein